MNRAVETFLRVLQDGALRMGGYFLLAVLVAALIKTWKLDKRIRHVLARAGGWGILLGTVAGLVSPLCSCGILPVVVSLAEAGVPTAPLMALLVTSPVMSPDAFVLTWGVLGRSFALGKLLGAAAMGLVAGGVVLLMERRGLLAADPWRGSRRPEHHCVDPRDAEDPRRGLTVTIGRGRYFLLMVGDMIWIIGRFLVLALVLQALLAALVPVNAVKVLLGRPTVVSLLLAVLVGLPLPLHQVAAVPVLRGLLDMGMDSGAAMALLMAGPVCSIPSLAFLAGMAPRRLLAVFLAVAAFGSLAVGVLYRILA